MPDDDTSMTCSPGEAVHRPGSIIAMIERADWHFNEAIRLLDEAVERSDELTAQEALEVIPAILRLQVAWKRAHG